MYKLTKTIKYSAINFETALKKIVVYRMHWIDSTYDVTITEKIVKLDGTVIRETTNTQICVCMDRLNAWLNTLKDIDIKHGYYVDIKTA